MITYALMALLVCTCAASTSLIAPVSADSAGGPSSTNDVTPAVLWMTPQTSTNVHHGDKIPMSLSFKNSEPFPVIHLGYVDASGRHYVTTLQYRQTLSDSGYSMTVPSDWPTGTFKAQSIVIEGISGRAGYQLGVGTHSRNQEYAGIIVHGTAPNNVPFLRKYNIDFTKLDLRIS